MRADGEQGHDRHRVADGGVRQEQSGHLKGVRSQRRAGGADGCVIHRRRRRGAHVESNRPREVATHDDEAGCGGTDAVHRDDGLHREDGEE